jgi:DNA-binding CsgD family transcriptional regulator/tetratricopeptide (TPR) repeat protein
MTAAPAGRPGTADVTSEDTTERTTEHTIEQTTEDRTTRPATARTAESPASMSVAGGMMYDVWADRSRTMALVGRDRELAAMRRLVGGNSPRAAALVLAGDAGVGKTRLLGEFLDRLAADGWRVLLGHCLDFGDTAMPYLPFTEMLRRLDQTDAGLTTELAAAHPALAQLSRTQRGADAPADGLERAEIFASMHACLEDVASRGPVVAVVEDAHWADASSRDLISFLLARGFNGPVALVVTYRSDDLHRRHPLRSTVAQWTRMPGVDRMQLGPLRAADVRRMIEALIGNTAEPAYAEDVERIVQRADGNPFYVEELVGAFVSGGGTLPEDLADLLLVRLDRLDDAARTLVREASVAGQRVPHDLLAAVSSLSGAAFEAAVRTALDQNILVRAGDDGYAFRHALLGEAVHDDLLPGERLRLHTAYAEAIRERSERGRPSPAALAWHAHAAHDFATALTASVDAGRQAMVVGGPEEAARHFQTALELYDRAAKEMERPPDIAEIVAEAADAVAASGHPLRALGLVAAQLDELPPDAPAESRARLLLAEAEAALFTESDVDMLAVTTEGLALVGEEPSPMRAKMLAVHAWSHIVADDYDAARAAATEALELAGKLEMVGLSADVRLTLSRLNQYENYGAEARADLASALDEARHRGDVEAQLAALFRLGIVHYEYAELDEARAVWVEAAELARRTNRPWAPFGFDGRMRAAMVDYVTGDWDSALRVTDTSGEAPPETLRALLVANDLLIAAGRGDTEALTKLPAVRERWRRDGLIAVISGAAAIDLRGVRDGVQGALAAYDEVVEVLADLWEPMFQAKVRFAALVMGHLVDAVPATASSARTELCARGDQLVADVEAVLETLEGRERRFGSEGQAWVARLRAGRLHLDWLCGRGTDEAALVEAWRASVAAFEEFGEVYEVARSRARLAAVLRAAGHPDEAAAEALRVREVALRLDAKPLLASVEGITGRAAPAPERNTDLTPREREILALVAEGRTNGEIARQLFISTKTVSVHVSNILAKLGASGRTEAAAIARRDGLL